MQQRQPLTQAEILNYYVRLRCYGFSGEQTVAALEAEAMRLSHQERRYLNQEVIKWEKSQKGLQVQRV